MTKTFIRCATAAGALLGAAAWSQEVHFAAPFQEPMPAFHVMIDQGKGVSGSPYSADEKTQSIQTLPDGNRIVRTNTTRTYRDQQGRTRVEQNGEGSEARSIMINDPVAHTHYMLMPENHTAAKMVTNTVTQGDKETIARMKARVEAEHPVMTFTDSTAGVLVANPTLSLSKVEAERRTTEAMTYSVRSRADSPLAAAEQNARTENLGTQNMEGLAVTGTRRTMTIPANTIGNDREIVITDERWYSPELQMTVMSKHNDPRSGETVFTVTNVSRANPDAALFQVPADFQVTDNMKNLMYLRTDSIKQ